MLREPVSFMHSLHMEYLNETLEDETDFARALEKEPLRKAGRCIPARVRCPSYLLYRERARYSGQLARYYAVFPRENILVMTMEEFRQDNERRYRDALGLLGVDPQYVPCLRRGVCESRAAQQAAQSGAQHAGVQARALQGSRPAQVHRPPKRVAGLVMKEQRRPELSPALERELRDEFGAEVQRVSELVGRDLRPALGVPGRRHTAPPLT